MTEELPRIRARADSLVEAHDDLMTSLIAMRKKHGLSQETIAERMSVSQPTVASFERYDSNPTLATIRRYALAVGARIQNSVIDDCAEHAANFERIVEGWTATVRPPQQPKGQWTAPRTKVGTSVRSS